MEFGSMAAVAAPLVTPAPSHQAVQFRLEARQDSVSQYCAILQDGTGFNLACNPGSVCAYDNFSSVQGCCAPSMIGRCFMPTACLDSSGLPSLKSPDPQFIGCPDSTAPFCVTVTFNNRHKSFMCSDRSTARTVSGSLFDDPLTFPLVTTGSLATRPTASPSSTSASGTSATPSSTPSSSQALPTTNPVNAISSSPGPALSTGSIVGIVFAVLAFIIAAAIAGYLLWRHRRAKKKEQAGNTASWQGAPGPQYGEYKPVPVHEANTNNAYSANTYMKPGYGPYDGRGAYEAPSSNIHEAQSGNIYEASANPIRRDERYELETRHGA